ncbi:hypothetical protein KTAU_35370 [Thermogemmatispora aurantia]|uniref:Uncharacterized protein n=1 Tax=Thermogemmatispora aurantia TaxID=2045279 RepID=A0A5J4KET9_9CHLR|nr:hypothetical protein [Thermogemmatispora aurantia]GER84901.1 hypothetical protein KTAU_35370 [Thermogemmatispora aurantia]
MEERRFEKRPRSLILAPVFVRVDERCRVPSPLSRPSWQELVAGWLRYQATQLRWDIERSLARLFHRSWIDLRRAQGERRGGESNHQLR